MIISVSVDDVDSVKLDAHIDSGAGYAIEDHGTNAWAAECDVKHIWRTSWTFARCSQLSSGISSIGTCK